MPTPQPRASSVSFPIPTLHVAPPPSKHCHTYMAHGLHGSDRHALCGLRENFDPAHTGATRSVQRGPCGTLRKVMARTITKRDQLALSSDDEDVIGGQSGLPSSCATPEPNSKRQQQYPSLSSPDDRALRGGVAGLGKGGSKDDDVATIVLPNVIF